MLLPENAVATSKNACRVSLTARQSTYGTDVMVEVDVWMPVQLDFNSPDYFLLNTMFD